MKLEQRVRKGGEEEALCGSRIKSGATEIGGRDKPGGEFLAGERALKLRARRTRIDRANVRTRRTWRIQQ